MRTSRRLVVPAVAAATALLLPGCGGDDGDGGAFGTGSGAGGTGGEDEAQEGGAGGGSIPSVAAVTGDWYVNPDDTMESHNLWLNGTDARFYENAGTDRDYCDAGTIDEHGHIELTTCHTWGDELWPAPSADVTLNADGSLTVVWASGVTEVYWNKNA
ncbi:hypothetical protein [Streptomyces sp. RFCAC02]|uniref:hypothetical protein n=1 Tax=Streptomyces sp. RFCAC02 TaxID=2499143 RepID=UPI0010225910|nr:hypothetical protein [Streptomyces sp. RFCAC02]